MSFNHVNNNANVSFDSGVCVKPEIHIDRCGRPNLYLRFYMKGGDNSCFFQGTWNNGLSRIWRIPGTNRGKQDDLHWVLFKWDESARFENLPYHYRELISSCCYFFSECICSIMREISNACYEETKKLRDENDYLKLQMRSRANNKRRRIKYVYLMRHTNGFTKIGFSTNPKVREKTLQAEDPRIEMLGYFPSSATIERKLHRIFAELRVRGEWFRLEDRHIDWILAIRPKTAKTRKRKVSI